MIEKAVAIHILEQIEADLKNEKKDKAIESIDRILNNKLYNLMTEYKKVLEKYGKNNKKTLKIEQKIDKEMTRTFLKKINPLLCHHHLLCSLNH